MIFDTLGKKPTEGALVFFDGKNSDGWVNRDGEAAEWIVTDGAMAVVPGKGPIFSL